jgi:hypothetical protein
LVLHQAMWNTVLGSTRHVQVIRQNFVPSTMSNLYCCCCCDLIYHLGAIGAHQHCNFLDLVSSSEISWPTSSSIMSLLCKMFVPLKHSTMTQGFFAVC